jgi:hypothetical protein
MREERKYSVAEIDEMRDSVGLMLIGGDHKAVEERLRTYMLNGTEPGELAAAALVRIADWREQCRISNEIAQLQRNSRG